MTLISKILNYMSLQKTHEVNLKELYEAFGDEKQTTIRGRINEAVGKRILRIGRGKYILIQDDVDAIVEQCDTRFAIPNILASLLYYDMIFLDIPYFASGQKGGNRDLSTYSLIMAEEFEKMILDIQKMLRHDDSQIYFMISGGKSSKKDVLKYLSAFAPTNLKVAGKGSYTKLTSTGKICNIGKYPIPPEDIYVYSHSGKLAKPEETILNFNLKRPPLARSGGYPTQKPFKLLEQIIKQSTNIGDSILDLFGGSGVTLDASLSLKRKCHIFDVANDSIKRMKSILNKYVDMSKELIEEKHSFFYSKKQLANFASGKLF